MNASILNTKIQMSAEFCEAHKVQKVRVGQSAICKQCATEILNKAHKDHEVEVNRMVREKHFEGAKLPARHANSGFKDYIVKNIGQQNAKQHCTAFTKDFKQGVNRNLIMVGRTGTGKTHLACAVARNILESRKYARYITSEDMGNEIANAWKKPDDTESNAIHRFTEYDLLILDEYGLHDRHENRLQLVHKVLYARYDAAKPTMLISNMTMAELQKDLGDRLWSRFQHDGLVIVECNWADQRVGGGV
ncbi:ATP-binding protein [Acinetobacter sp. ANC 7200]|uniref:ATP-binding protein n=1 Tax=Acinetobacter amyesii TaxID=2942470 RepID=UPI0020C0D8BF|nr:ATP-binding protein [Acinetobacter amyesii]MCL6243794.1 ATP-binding protein [Acinetobacter amyesii]